MKQKLFGLVAVFLALILCTSAIADTINLSSEGYNHNVVAGASYVTVISFDYNTGGNDTTVNFRRLKDDGGDGWMMPVDFTSTYIEVDSDYGPYRYNVSLSGTHNYVFTLNRLNGLWTLAIDGSIVDFVATSSTTTPQPDGTAVTIGAVVANKYFSDETAESGQNAVALGWSDAVDGIGSAGAYKVKFPQASGSYIENLTVTPMSGMVMYYDFDSVGTIVADGSGHGNDAIVVGNVTGNAYGRSGADAVFGGTPSDALDVGATPLADRPSSAVSIAAWCKVDDTDQDMSVFNAYGPKPSDPGSNAYLYHMEVRTGTDRYRWCVRNEEGETIGSYYYYPPDGVITDEWFHFACTYDAASADANNLKMYINGEFVLGMAAEAVSDLNVGTNWDHGAAIGYTADAQSRNYKGQMDEFYMFNRALTPTEISMLASVSWLNNGGFETGDLIGWTTFDGSEYGEWGEAGTYEIIESPNSIGQGDYSAQITGGQQCGIAQAVAIPAGTLVQVDSLWSGTCGTNYWAEIKVLTHTPGTAYNLNESDMGGTYAGDWQYVAKSDTYGPLNPKPSGIWDWEDAATGSAMAGNTIISKGEVIVATKIGGASGMIMAVDNMAVMPLYSVTAAYAPQPEDGHEFSWRDFNDVTLSWTGGFLAASHDVYLGTDFNDVNDATNVSPEFMGSVASPSYVPTLVPGNTYFWRIDEVNGVDTWKGEVWSFVYPSVPVTNDMNFWWKCDDGDGDILTDSVSGLNGTITNYGSYMEWEDDSLIFYGTYGPDTGVTFDTNEVTSAFTVFDRQATCSWWQQSRGFTGNNDIFKAGNLAGERVLHAHCPTGSGHYMVTAGYPDLVYYWEIMNPEDDRYIPIFNQWRHFAFTKDADAPYIKIYIDGQLKGTMTNRYNWGGTQDGGPMDTTLSGSINLDIGKNDFEGALKDIRFYNRALSDIEIDALTGDFPLMAKAPSPADGATDVPYSGASLSWEAGRDIESHRVYFDVNMVAVQNADINSPCYMGEVSTTSYDLGGLNLNETYYWRIDEVDDNGKVYLGDVWSFLSIQYIMVEDFESYDNEGNDVTAVWVDVDTSGAGDMQRFLATDPDYPVLSPVNSLRLRYRLTAWGDLAYYAKTSRTFSPSQDWTQGGVKILTVNYYGDGGNFDLPMLVTVGDGTTNASVSVDANTVVESWNEVNVSLAEIAAAGVDLTNVSYMEIGFGDGTNLGSSTSQYDMIYVDDISLYPPKCVLSESSLQGDITEDCVVNYDDLDELAFDWLLGGYTVSAAGSVSDDDLVLHYDFENNTVDSVAGNNGTLQSLGASANYDAGHDGGRCIHFYANATDSGSNMIVPPAAFADVNEEVTFSLWLKNDTDAPDWYMNVFGATSTSTNRTNLFRLYSPAFKTNMLSVFHGGSGGNSGWGDWDAIQFTQPETFDYLAWNHLALVKNCYNGEMWFYANGELMIHKRGEINKMYGCDEFKLGSNYGDGAFWPGCIDDFRVYNRALSHAEVLTLAGQASATVPISMFNAEDSDVNDDAIVDFKDYSVVAGEWLVEDLWP